MEHINEEFAFLTSLIKGIANQFGQNCETVLLDLTNFGSTGSTIVAIENGHITERQVGDSGTNLGLEVLRGTDQRGDKHNYITHTKKGKILRSTTQYIRNSESIPIGCICINFDVTNFVLTENILKEFTLSDEPENSGMNKDTNIHELFVNDVNELVDSLIHESHQIIGKPVPMMSKEDKIKGIQYLDQKGLFLIQKSGGKVCEYFDISKYTLYNYLEQTREKKH